MPTKKQSPKSAPKSAPETAGRNRKPKFSGGVSTIASSQIKQLRKTVAQLTSRLEKEIRMNATSAKVIAETKKARVTLIGQLKTLREEGSHLAKELKRALSDADTREAARRQAHDTVAKLRGELTHRTEELKRKSEELARLVVGSAGRAKNIIMREASPSEETSRPPTEAEPDTSGTKETESISSETVKREESPRESSIEREIHPERKLN